MKDLHQTLTIDDETGGFEPKGRFLRLDIMDQIDLLTRQSNRFITQHIGFSGAENRT